MKLKLLIGLLVSTTLITPSAYAGFQPPTMLSDTSKNGIFLFEDSSAGWNNLPSIIGSTSGGDQYLCTNYAVSECKKGIELSNLKAHIILGICDSDSENPCVESLELGNTQEDLIPATYIKSVGANQVTGIKEYSIPKGGTASLWESKKVTNAGGVGTYQVLAVIDYNVRGTEVVPDFSLQVIPYKLVNGPQYSALSVSEGVVPSTGRRFVGISHNDTNIDCNWVDIGECGVTQDFSPNTIARVKLKVPNQVSGWLRGRLDNPVIDVRPLNEKFNTIVVTGGAVSVPQFFATLPVNKVDELLQSVFGPTPDNEAKGAVRGMSLGGDGASKVISTLRDFVGDKSAGQKTLWAVQNVSRGNGSMCLQSRNELLGLVTTNAMNFDGQAPSFEDGTLNYKVAGTHFASDGTIQKGFYKLQLRSKTARCLYGFTSAPISATVTVLSSEGVPEVSTATLTESNGWIYLSAYGFSFSNPTVRIKLSQEKIIDAATSLAKQDTNTKVVKSTTIICIKGKVSKKVTEVSPKCPVGYKKK